MWENGLGNKCLLNVRIGNVYDLVGHGGMN